MKKNGILNSHISEVLSRLGHTDTIVISDCGLPIPDGVLRIDISLQRGQPSFQETLKVLLTDMIVEKVTLAEEIKGMNEKVNKMVLEHIEGNTVEYVSHETFKERTKHAKAIIRTGEITPYANIILHAGVIF